MTDQDTRENTADQDKLKEIFRQKVSKLFVFMGDIVWDITTEAEHQEIVGMMTDKSMTYEGGVQWGEDFRARCFSPGSDRAKAFLAAVEKAGNKEGT